MPEPMTAKGTNGQLTLLEDTVKISRKGLMSFSLQGLKGDKEIALSSISSIQFKTAGIVGTGYIQFAFMGGQEAKRGLMQSFSDENTVTFNKKHQAEFEAVKAEIDRRRLASARPQATVASPADEIAKLAELRDKGILTAAEFEAKKKQVLDV